jgi:hypothetical protein
MNIVSKGIKAKKYRKHKEKREKKHKCNRSDTESSHSHSITLSSNNTVSTTDAWNTTNDTTKTCDDTSTTHHSSTTCDNSSTTYESCGIILNTDVKKSNGCGGCASVVTRGEKCKKQCCKKGPTGQAGIRGPTGPTGPGADNNCVCIDQVRYVLQQLTGSNISTVTDGDVIFGTIVGITGSNNIATDSVLVLDNGIGELTFANLCSVGQVFNNDGYTGLSFLNAPNPPATGCEAECELSVRNILTPLIGNGLYYDVHTTNGATIVSRIIDVVYGIVFLDQYGLEKSGVFLPLCKFDHIKPTAP